MKFYLSFIVFFYIYNLIDVNGQLLSANLSSASLVENIRNHTNNLVNRLEGPRNRVIDWIAPAVNTSLTRNLTLALNSIWDRVQTSNISIIKNPIVQIAVVKPINDTLKRIANLTNANNINNETDEPSVEVVNLDALESINEEMKLVDQKNDNQRPKRQLNLGFNNLFDQENILQFFRRIRETHFRDCLAYLICDYNCRPEVYGRYSTIVQQITNRILAGDTFFLSREEINYYIVASRLGQKSSTFSYDLKSQGKNCELCKRYYRCNQDRNFIMRTIFQLGNFGY